MQFKKKPTNLIKYQWETVDSFEKLQDAVLFYLKEKATLQSGRKNSFWKESDSIYSVLCSLTGKGFITLSSQPSIMEDKMWQRFYVTGLIQSDRASSVVEKLRSRNFIVLCSTFEKSAIIVSPSLLDADISLPLADAEVNIEIKNGERIVLPDNLLPLTLLKQGINRWNPVNSIPIPFALSEIAEMDSVIEFDDDGELFEYQIANNFKQFFSKEKRQELFKDITLLTIIHPEWKILAPEISNLISSCI